MIFAVNPNVAKLLNSRKMVLWVDEVPIKVVSKDDTVPPENVQSEGSTPTSSKKSEFPEAAIPDLIRLFHGSTKPRKTLIKEFLSYWNAEQDNQQNLQNEMTPALLTKASVLKKVKEVASKQEFPEEGPMFNKLCWFVKREMREKFGLLDLPLPNVKEDVATDSAKKGSPSLITMFTKVLTEDERKSQLKLKTAVK